mmetsp:Transcript_10818/g.36711  ORF Transcript_10818/g.36711 Transcript_10818/m.36711 type:complete len:164 (-) Transcript_10818:46-537(-)
MYCGEIAGLVPSDPVQRAQHLAALLTVLDLANECHDAHHPLGVAKFYEDQKAEAKVRALGLTGDRLGKFLSHFEDTLARAGPEGGFLAGPECGVADLALMHVVAGLEHAFPRAFARASAHAPSVVALARRVRARPGVAAYLASDRRLPFSQHGLFRHYPELDE